MCWILGVLMEANAERPRSTRNPWSTRKKASVVAIATVLAASIALILIFNPLYERHVSYDYRATIESDASGQFVVICSLPADYRGTVYPDVLSSMVVVGDVTISEVATPYGDGLEIVGTGSAMITWNHNFTYRTSTQSEYDHYSNLSMLDAGYFSGNAFVHLEGASANLSLSYMYQHDYGGRVCAGERLGYQVAGNLTTGWNELSVTFWHLGH
jgi:hypothetical protein